MPLNNLIHAIKDFKDTYDGKKKGKDGSPSPDRPNYQPHPHQASGYAPPNPFSGYPQQQQQPGEPYGQQRYYPQGQLPGYPPQPPQQSYADPNQLGQQFGSLSLNNSSNSTGFVGGFGNNSSSAPPGGGGGSYYPTPPPFPNAPSPAGPYASLPAPNIIENNRPSLIMAHAISAPPAMAMNPGGFTANLGPPPMTPPRPGSVPIPQAQPQYDPYQVQAQYLSPTGMNMTPTRPNSAPHSLASPTSIASPSRSTPKSGEDTVQCSGTTKSGKRCTRIVKFFPLFFPFSSSTSPSPSSSPGDQIERFCHQHTKEVLSSSGFYAHLGGGDKWVEYQDWIPSYLQDETQAALRIEMGKPKSGADVDGYIYTFEIRDKSTTTIQLKVGRAINLVKRIDQWSKQCGSHEQVLRGWWPGVVDDADGPGAGAFGGSGNGGGTDAALTVMKGRVKQGEPGKCCHRLEKLVHLELADLAVNEVYLRDGFPGFGGGGGGAKVVEEEDEGTKEKGKSKTKKEGKSKLKKKAKDDDDEEEEEEDGEKETRSPRKLVKKRKPIVPDDEDEEEEDEDEEYVEDDDEDDEREKKKKAAKRHSKTAKPRKKRVDEDEEDEDGKASSGSGSGSGSGGSGSDAPKKKGKKSKSAPSVARKTPCPDCGTMHKEIFTFTRPQSGRYKGKEWELIVKPVIEKWGAFVEAFVG